MATKLEENFVKKHIKGTQVFEFGNAPGKFFEETSWKEASIDDYGKYDNKHRGLLCCVLEKGE